MSIVKNPDNAFSCVLNKVYISFIQILLANIPEKSKVILYLIQLLFNPFTQFFQQFGYTINLQVLSVSTHGMKSCRCNLFFHLYPKKPSESTRPVKNQYLTNQEYGNQKRHHHFLQINMKTEKVKIMIICHFRKGSTTCKISHCIFTNVLFHEIFYSSCVYLHF